MLTRSRIRVTFRANALEFRHASVLTRSKPFRSVPSRTHRLGGQPGLQGISWQTILGLQPGLQTESPDSIVLSLDAAGRLVQYRGSQAPCSDSKHGILWAMSQSCHHPSPTSQRAMHRLLRAVLVQTSISRPQSCNQQQIHQQPPQVLIQLLALQRFVKLPVCMS